MSRQFMHNFKAERFTSEQLPSEVMASSRMRRERRLTPAAGRTSHRQWRTARTDANAPDHPYPHDRIANSERPTCFEYITHWWSQCKLGSTLQPVSSVPTTSLRYRLHGNATVPRLYQPLHSHESPLPGVSTSFADVDDDQSSFGRPCHAGWPRRRSSVRRMKAVTSVRMSSSSEAPSSMISSDVTLSSSESRMSYHCKCSGSTVSSPRHSLSSSSARTARVNDKWPRQATDK